MPDKDRKGEEFWEFGKTICGEEIFVKLKTVSEYACAIWSIFFCNTACCMAALGLHTVRVLGALRFNTSIKAAS